MTARDIQYTESLGESTTTSATYQDKVSLTFTPKDNTDYILMWSADIIEISTTVSAFSRLYNSTDAAVLDEQNQENRTTSGAPYRYTGGIAKYSAGSSPGSHTFKIQYHDSDGASTAKIRNARLLAIEVLPQDAYAEYLTDQTTTSNTYVDGSGPLTFTPGTSGDYLIFASCNYRHGSTADLGYIRLLDPDGSTAYCEMQQVNRDATNYNPYVAMVKTTLAASSQTFKLQTHRTSANTITLSNQRIFAMRLDAGFSNAYVAQDRTRATTSSTTYQDDNSLTQSTNAADHLIFNCVGTENDLNTVSHACQFLEDGNVMQGPFEARVNTSATTGYTYPQFIAYKATLTAASHTWKRQYKSLGGTTVTGIDEDATAVLEISTASAYTLTADYGSYTLTGQATGLKASRALTAAQGSYTLTGHTVALKRDARLIADYGSYALSGQAVGLKAARTLVCNYDSYTLTGEAANLTAQRKLSADYGSYALTGQDATLTYTPSAAVITAETGYYTLTGYDVTFTYTSVTPEPVIPPSTGGGGGWRRVQDEIEEEKRREKLKQKKAKAKAPAQEKPKEKAVIKTAISKEELEPKVLYEDLAALAQLSLIQSQIQAAKLEMMEEEEAIEILLLTMH